jgi:hypothetical protein
VVVVELSKVMAVVGAMPLLLIVLKLEKVMPMPMVEKGVMMQLSLYYLTTYQNCLMSKRCPTRQPMKLGYLHYDINSVKLKKFFLFKGYHVINYL